MTIYFENIIETKRFWYTLRMSSFKPFGRRFYLRPRLLRKQYFRWIYMVSFFWGRLHIYFERRKKT